METIYKGGKHPIQHIDDILQNCTPETYIILLTNVTLKKLNKYSKYQ